MKYYTYIFNISRVGASKVFAHFRRVLRQLTVVGRTASSLPNVNESLPSVFIDRRILSFQAVTVSQTH